jgi:hypothetical protein
MEIMLKNNIVFIGYNDSKLLKEKILEFIFEAKTEKILYKGIPSDVNYKLLKKILPTDQIQPDFNHNSIFKFVDITPKKGIRDIYQDLLDKIKCEYCLIYKI